MISVSLYPHLFQCFGTTNRTIDVIFLDVFQDTHIHIHIRHTKTHYMAWKTHFSVAFAKLNKWHIVCNMWLCVCLCIGAMCILISNKLISKLTRNRRRRRRRREAKEGGSRQAENIQCFCCWLRLTFAAKNDKNIEDPIRMNKRWTCTLDS